jgi:hypothetical protein
MRVLVSIGRVFIVAGVLGFISVFGWCLDKSTKLMIKCKEFVK